jgi:CheY-like chemotaxis protein
MDICCPRCAIPAETAGHEDGRGFFSCPRCKRVWSAPLASFVWTERATPAAFVPRVMVVDDSDQMVGLLSLWLEDEGCEVFTALTGREALDVAAIYYPDIVFLDVVMPPPDGFHVYEALRHLLAPEVILMTGTSNPDVPRRAAELGIATLLRKPFTHEAAVDAYARALDRCRRDPLSRLRDHFGSVQRARNATPAR